MFECASRRSLLLTCHWLLNDVGADNEGERGHETRRYLKRALKTRTLAEQQRTLGGCCTFSKKYVEFFFKLMSRFGSAFEADCLCQMKL